MIGAAVRTFVCSIFLILCWLASVVGFGLYVNHYSLEPNVRSDGIVVLTGGGGRIDYGLELLATGRGNALFISGVSDKVSLEDLIHKAPANVQDGLNDFFRNRITIGHEATNTIGNAEESTRWVLDRHLKSVLLVTADYHLPRALLEFTAALPKDIVIIPAPLKTRDYATFSWLGDPEMRNLIFAEFHKLLAAYARQLLVQYHA